MTITETSSSAIDFLRTPEIYRGVQQYYERRYSGAYSDMICAYTEEMFEFAEKVFSKEDPVDFLDNTPEGEDRSYEIAHLLQPLSKELIEERLGRKVLEWFGCRTPGNEDEPANTVAALGYDLELFRKAKKYAWVKRSHSSLHKDIMPHYFSMERLFTGGLDSVDLPRHLTESSRTESPISDARINNYRLEPVQASRFISPVGTSEGMTCIDGSVDKWSYDHEKNLYYSLWLDSPTGIVLIYRDVPQAVVGLATHGRELVIQQLQGIRPWRIHNKGYELEKVARVHSRGLYPFDWQRLMIAITEDFAQQGEIDQLTIQSGRKNKWIKPQGREKEAHMTLDQALSAYDKQAKRLGFVYDRSSRNWTRTLE